MPSVGFEPTISAGEWSQTYALDRAATGTGCLNLSAEIKEEIIVQRLVTVHSGRNVKGKLHLSLGSSSSYVCHAST